MHTLRLTERRSRDVRLPRHLVARLADDFRHVLDVIPSLERGRYRLTPRGRVGSLSLGEWRIEIRPKVPLRTLFDLLDLDEDEPEFSDPDLHSPTGLTDFFAARLARLMSRATSQGLPQRYLEHDGASRHLRGRLDLAAQARHSTRPSVPFQCRFDELTVDHPENQFPKACAVGLLQVGGLSAEVGARLRAALPDFEQVSTLPPDHPSFSLLRADAERDHPELIRLCGWISSALSGTAPGFMLDLEQLFEQYLTRGLRTELAIESSLRVMAQPTTRLGLGSDHAITFRPDAVIESDNAAVAVLDAKWKSFTGTPEPDDLHQMMAYQSVLGVHEGWLVYPGRRTTQVRAELPNGSRLVIQTLGVTQGRSACRAAIRQLARSSCQGWKRDSTARAD